MKKTDNVILRRSIVIIVLTFHLFLSFGQDGDSWLDSFSASDKTKIQDINTATTSIDINIFNLTQSFNNDTIIKFLNNKDTLASQILPLTNEKIEQLEQSVKIYDSYIESTKLYIDSIPDYKSNADLSLNFIDENKTNLDALPTGSSDRIYQNTQNQIEKIKLLESIVIFQKQFFTFFSLANKPYLIQKGLNQSAGDTETVQVQNNEHESVADTTPAPVEYNEQEPANDTTPVPVEYNEPQSVNKADTGTSEDFQYANVIVNDQIVESIKVVMKDYKEDSTLSLFTITNFDMDKINKKWDNFQYGPDSVETPENSENPVASDSSDVQTSNSNNETTEPINPTTEEQPLDYNNELANTSPDKSKPAPIAQITEEIDYSKDLIYRVQVAADKLPLTDDVLQSIYKGSREIKMFQEEGWYKYYIADTKTLKEAIIIKKESKVPDAFIMAYKNGKKIKYYLKYAKAEKGSVPPDKFIDLKSLSENKMVIVVQVAADKVPLSRERLKELYQGGKPLNYIYEDGWHKYSFGNYKRFWPANIARRKCGVKDAFVVAYKNGVKFDLWAKDEKD